MNDNFFLGYPVEFKDVCLVYPPKIKELLTLKEFPIYSNLFTISQEEIEDGFVERGIDLKEILTPLEYLLNNCYHSKELENVVLHGFIFFIHEPVHLLYDQKKILIGKIEDYQKMDQLKFRCLDEDNYFDFQNLIREACGRSSVEPPDPNEHPKIKAMKAKARYRDKVKARKQGLRLDTIMASICCMGFGLNPLNIGELSYPAAFLLMSTYQEKEKYDIDIRSILAGADSKKIKPVYWIRNLDKQ